MRRIASRVAGLFFAGNAFSDSTISRRACPARTSEPTSFAAAELVLFGDPLSAVDTIVEIAVGVACLLAAVGTWRREGLRWISIALGVAGLAAVGHALTSLGELG